METSCTCRFQTFDNIVSTEGNATTMATDEEDDSPDENPDKNIAAEAPGSQRSPLCRAHWRHWSPYPPTRPSKSYRYKVPRYTTLLANCTAELSALDPLPVPHVETKNLHDSLVLNTPWTATEKAKFFTALARCGRGNLDEVARRVGTKGIVACAAYVGILEQASVARRKRFVGYDLMKVPAAVEVDDDWVRFEEKMARRLQKRDDEVEEEGTEDDDEVFNCDGAEGLLEM
jgi:hypothetical protein